MAVSGSSSKTFRISGVWDKLLAQLKSGDYVMCQFGHNDSHVKGNHESTNADTDYQENMKKIIADVRAKKGNIILVTPMHRGCFDKNGKLSRELQPYADAVKKVGAETNVTVIDLYISSGQYMEKIGGRDIAPIFSVAKNDRTNFSEKGAVAIAGLIVKDIADTNSQLAQYLKPLQ